ncbi:MAG: hypothetical protein EXS05_21055 [Planctomycetaceae bacterium]|nr:hypothetical protein [Planctomycetaceae bacterium]
MPAVRIIRDLSFPLSTHIPFVAGRRSPIGEVAFKHFVLPAPPCCAEHSVRYRLTNLAQDALTRAWKSARLMAIAFSAAAALGWGTSNASAQPPTMRVRVEWTSYAPAVWSGTFAVDSGELSHATSLGTSADVAGTLWNAGCALKLARRRAAADDGLEFSLKAPPDSTLRVALQSTAIDGVAAPIEIRVSDLYHTPRVFEATGDRPRIVVRRAPGDVLPLRIARPHLIFDPGETFHFDVGLNLLEPNRSANKPVRADLRWKMYAYGGTRSVAEGSTTLAAIINSATPVEGSCDVPLPASEGVYKLRLTAGGHGFDDVERVVQLVVLDPQSAKVPGAAEEKLVDGFDTAKGGALRRVSSSSRHARGEGSLARWWKRRPHDDARDPEPETGPPNWKAYRLHVDHPGRPHRLSVRLAAGETGPVGLCVLEAGAAGRWTPAGPDRLWQAAANRAGGTGSSTSPELIFWANDREPIVLVHRVDSTTAPEIERIELFELGERLPAALSDELPATAGGEQVPRRLCGPYFARPSLAEYFGAPQARDPGDQQPFDDWQTFLVAGRRLIETLHQQGSNAVLLAVAADGAALYPSRYCEATARFDTGFAASSGPDPIQKDVLELWLRQCDREQLIVVPEIQLNSPLPTVERLIREAGASAQGVQLLNAAGQTWAEAHPDRGGAGYNPLDPRVQAAVLDLVGELVNRYRRHPALGGVAFDAGHESCLQLPGIEWGYDAATIGRFEHASGVRVPKRVGPKAIQTQYEFLTTTARREWLAWRAAELTRFQQQLAEAVTSRMPTARVLLTGSGLATDRVDGTFGVSTLLRGAGHAAQQLLERGLDFSSTAVPSQLTVLRPSWTGLPADPLQQAALTTLNQSPVIDTAYRSVCRGSLSYALPFEARIQGAGALFDQESSDVRLPMHTVSSSGELRQRWAHALGSLDARVIFEGGAVLPAAPVGPEAQTRRAISRLPDVPFLQVGTTSQPLVIRLARTGEATWLCLVNPTSLTVSGSLTLSCPVSTRIVDLATNRPLALDSTSAQPTSPQHCRFDWQLSAFEILCCRLDHPQTSVLETKVALGDTALAGLGAQVDRLHGRMSSVAELARSSVAPVSNAGFEDTSDAPGAATVPGWNLPLENAGWWSLDETNPRSGRYALRLATESDRGLLVSPPLSLDRARHATLTLWMRSNRSAAQVQLTLAGCGNDSRALQRQSIEVGKAWKKYEFRVAGLPFDTSSEVQLRVEPLDSGKLWIDDLELDVQTLSADDLRQLTKTASAIHLAWEQKRYADCERLLSGYWGRFLLEEPVETAPNETVPGATPPPAAKPRFGTRVRQFLQQR